MALAPMRPDSDCSTETLTHCPYCALNCGLKIVTENGRVQGMSRWKESPLTTGALCTKGVFAHEQIEHRDRLRRPLIKRDGVFVEADWDEALDTAARGFRRIADMCGPDANALLSGGSLTNEKVYVLGKFARLALGTPHVDYNGRFCMVAAGAAHKRAFGADRMMTPLHEIDNAEVVVIVGANLSAAFPIVLPQAIERLRRRGGRVIVIDPRGSRFVKPGDLHLALRPATDSALFNGLLRAVHEAGHVDTSFVEQRTTGFEKTLQACEPFHLDRVAQLTDLAVEDIAEAAELIGSTERCIYLHGRGPEQQIDGTNNVTSIINLGLACGHVGKPGSGINMLTGQRNGQGGREWGQRCNQLPAGRNIEDANDRAVVAEHWGVEPSELPGVGKTYVEILQMAEHGEVRGLLSIGTNMSVSAPDLAAVDRQMTAFEHVVMIEPFFSQSCQYADVVLPGSVWAEEEGTITTIEGRVVRVDQAVEPAAGLSDIDVVRELASRLDAAQHFPSSQGSEIFDEMIAVSAGGINDYSGMSWERIRSEGGLFWPCPSPDHPGTPQLYGERFFHTDGLARFAPVDPKQPPAVCDAAYPIVLTTGRVLPQFLSGNQTMRIEDHQRKAPGPVLEVHPLTALSLNLAEGRRVRITSRQGSSTLPWVANEMLRGDTVFLPYHWVECNQLLSAELDPLSGIPGFKYTPVQLEPAPAQVVVPRPSNVAAYPVNLDVTAKSMLIVGGGLVAHQKMQAMLRAGAHVHVVAPAIDKRIRTRAATNVADGSTGLLSISTREYHADDLDGMWLVLACTDDPLVNRTVHVDAEERRIWSNSADDPTNCAWTLPSVVRQGDLQIAISTNGRSPALSKWLRQHLEAEFDERWLGLLDVVSDVRELARQQLGTSEVAGWIEALDGGAFDDAMEGNVASARDRLVAALTLIGDPR